MHIRFDEHDDVVVDDIPDDVIFDLALLAGRTGRSVEDEMRRLLLRLAEKWKAEAE